MPTNKRIGLISPHRDPNYGTMLQAYALAKAIEHIGGRAEYISYHSYITRNTVQKALYYLLNPWKILSRFKQNRNKNSGIDDYSFFKTPEFATITNEFEDFYQKHIPHTSVIYNPKTIRNITGFSKFIVGSDQTWSPILYRANSINFLDFVKEDAQKNSYAPSLGTTNIPEDFQKLLKEKLSSFNNLSCREKSNCKVIGNLTGKLVVPVLDPTLLLSPKLWSEIAKPLQMPRKYILCYILGERKCISDFAEMLGKKKNMPVYYIVTRPVYLNKRNCLKELGPSHFITLISKATYVVTDSFHGTIFSINFNRNFYCFSKREEDANINDNNRLMEILSDFKLTNRYRNDGETKLVKDINFEKINQLLSAKRSESENYLRRIVVDE
jgi:hypothetical protein